MPRAFGIKQLIAPNQGLITEQSKINPIEGSTISECNFTFNDDGSIRERRLGINNEVGSSFFSLNAVVNSTSASSYHEWTSVGGDGTLTFHVFQIGATLWFIKEVAGNLSSEVQSFNYDLDLSVTASATTTSTTPVAMEHGEGRLFVVGKNINPFYLDYDATAIDVTATVIPIEIRDLTGLDDGYEVDERPATLTQDHQYNLKNQGWWQTRIIVAAGPFVDPVASFFTVNAVYPSNADIAYLGMVDDGTGVIIFKEEELLELTLGNTPAPKGHFIFEPFDISYDDLRTGTLTGGGGFGAGAQFGGGVGTVFDISDPDWFESGINFRLQRLP